jgi:pyridinium-3,5-biscarboxylic acid mononucleotide sulfurtransferase
VIEDLIMADKLDHLRNVVEDLGSALVCFSGGVDSTLLLRVAHDVLGDRAVALTAVSPAVSRREVDEARAIGAAIGARHLVVESHEMDRRDFTGNPVDRCYHCKTELLGLARPEAERLGLAHVCLGTNLDDLGDHRPGLRAADERGAAHPLVDAGLSKADVRELSRRLGLSTWDKPQMACLSSRIPYGTEITVERLARVERFEDALRDLGFLQLRVRFHDATARIEVSPADMARALEAREAICEVGRRLGFTYVALDLAGYRSGAMNEAVSSAAASR